MAGTTGAGFSCGLGSSALPKVEMLKITTTTRLIKPASQDRLSFIA
ncbi:hypothetical protein [Synechococcus sp. CBW1107]|nr:hypothetical protein [Synechococcus sp. CBW1107]